VFVLIPFGLRQKTVFDKAASIGVIVRIKKRLPLGKADVSKQNEKPTLS